MISPTVFGCAELTYSRRQLFANAAIPTSRLSEL
jgi:hypothetical protein